MPKAKTKPIRRASQTTANTSSSGFSQTLNAGQGIAKAPAGHRGTTTTAVKGQRTCCGG